MAGARLTSSFNTAITDVDYKGTAVTQKFIYDKVVTEDISRVITDVDPQKSPFLRFLELMGNKEKTSNFKFQWLTDDNKPLRGTVAAGAGVIGSNSSTDLVTNESNLYVAGHVLKVIDSTGATEILTVTSKTNATTYVVARGAAGSTASASIASASEILTIGTAFDENTGAADPDSSDPNWYYNFTQNFKDAVAISGRMDVMDILGTSSLDAKELNKRMKDHIEKIETALLFGNRYQNASTNLTFTGGLEYMISTYAASGNTIDASAATFNEAYLDNIGNDLFRYGSKKKLALVSGQTISKISTFAKEYLRINDKASVQLGMEVTDYKCSHGTLSFVHSRTLEQTDLYNKYMFVIDPANVKKRFMTGRDTKIKMNVQANDLDGKKHSIESDIGLQLTLPNAHFVVTGIVNTI